MTDHMDIEQRLKRDSPHPPPPLRARVLDAVDNALAADHAGSNAGWLAGLAAALLIGMNLALIAGEQQFLPPPVAETDRLDPSDLVAKVRQALPELNDQQTRDLALSLSLHRKASLVPIAEPRPTRYPQSTDAKETQHGTPAALD